MARPRTYDWDSILAGAVLRQGEDYEVPTRDMQSAIYAEAKRQKLKVKTRCIKATSKTDEGIEVRPVRASGPRDWDFLLNGDPHPVWASDLTTTTPQSFVRQARRAAVARDLRVRTKIVPNGVWVQALDKG